MFFCPWLLSKVSGASGSSSNPAGVIVAGMGVKVESGFSNVFLTLILCSPKIPIKELNERLKPIVKHATKEEDIKDKLLEWIDSLKLYYLLA